VLRLPIFKAVSVALLVAAPALAQSEKAKPASNPAAAPKGAELKAKASYALGLNLSQGLKSQGVEIDVEEMIKGLRDGFSTSAPKMTPEEMQSILTAFQKELQEQKMAGMKADAEKGAKEGAAFLAENAKKEGVKVLPSGLQYKVLKQGAGQKPTSKNVVKTHYRGTLIDGREFDSSYKRGEPAEFPVGGVIAGWTEALQLMPVGSKYQLFIPAKLAYGEQAPPGSIIPANGTLIFEVELLGIVQ
jgi:FKBP-type peptidyl-prolyl cis-trans isomerase FklB